MAETIGFDRLSRCGLFFCHIFFDERSAETGEKWAFCRNVSNDSCGNMGEDGVK